MGLNYNASSPTLVLPPQAPSKHYLANSAHQQSLPKNSSIGGFRAKYPTPPSLNYLAASSNATAGRKRTLADVDPEETSPDGSYAVQLPAKPKGEPIYGPGMTLIYPEHPGYSIAAESQSGTWVEEKYEKLAKEENTARPVIVSRKSQRRDIAIDEKPAWKQSPESIIDENGNTVDTLIKTLGIGWKNIMTNETLRDAARAYARVIENHFDLTEPVIMLESEALSAYLVRAKQYGVEKYWLFHDSLAWCQLVGANLQQAVNNLMARPIPAVVGERIDARVRSLSPSAQAAMAQDVEMSAPKDVTIEDEAMQL